MNAAKKSAQTNSIISYSNEQSLAPMSLQKRKILLEVISSKCVHHKLFSLKELRRNLERKRSRKRKPKRNILIRFGYYLSIVYLCAIAFGSSHLQ